MKRQFTMLVGASALGLTLLSYSASSAEHTMRPKAPRLSSSGAGSARSGGSAGSAGAPAAAESAGAAARQRNRPNIVFVLTDDLAGDLVKYMPNVRQMQRRGTTFSRYFVTDSLCCPSRSTIFTGNYPHNTGVFTNSGSDGGYAEFNKKGNQQKTFAVALRRAGYRTSMMGKYLNGYQPQDRVPPGWSDWHVAGNAYGEFDYKLNENGRVVSYGHRARDYLTDVLNRKGVNFVRRSATDNKPFLLEIATFAPHAPYTPAPRDAKKFPNLKAPRGPAFNEPNIADKPPWLRHHPKLTRTQIRHIDQAFRNRVRAVQAVDKMIGDLRQALRATGQARDTYFVFSSDNGYHMGQHRLTPGKQTAFETDIKVPLIVTGPGVRAGREVGQLAANTDLSPTFADLAGARLPSAVDGRSLVRALTGGTLPARDAVLIEHHGPNLNAADPDLQSRASGNPPSYEAIRTRDAIYVEYAGGAREYYNLSRDPHELTNTVQRLSAAERRRLHTLLLALQACRGATCHR